MLMDISSELIHSLLPLFMVGTLGANAFTVGLIEGVAEASALIVKVFSGALSDFLGKRKTITLVGYLLAALTKPFFAFATSPGLVFGARLIDRVGKGIRGAPRDALITDITPPHLRGAAFGLRQSLDTIGAFLGPLLAVGLMLLWENDFRSVFKVAVIPAVLAVGLFTFGVHEPESRALSPSGKNPIQREALRALSLDYWWVVVLGSVFTLARFSEAFLLLRAREGGIPVTFVPLVMVAMNLVYSLTAYPFGKISDRADPRALLALSLVTLIASDIVLSLHDDWITVVLGVSLWGIHMGMSQGLLSALVANTAPQNLRGTAFGFFNLTSGVSLLISSAIAGFLWQTYGASRTFQMGGVFASLALLLLIRRPKMR